MSKTPAAKKLGPFALAIALETLDEKAAKAFARFQASNGLDELARAEAERCAAAMQALCEAALS